ncbi:MAG TPA: aldo/keto reductase [Gammaproteobacteria bacterium]|jgi:aryl-alcohol dehydrogenase-like predicted oxidoreductase|nr:aldo/keto reductase [Gammaproteobacteria bacterium]
MNSKFKLAGSIEINRLGYGAMQLTGPGVFGDATDRTNAIKILQTAIAESINFIDTADSYGPHTNEVLIADALFPYKNLTVATKGGFERSGPGQWLVNGNPDYIRDAIDGSLKRLRVEAIDLWQLHRVDSRYPIEETLAPVAAAVKAGKIKHVGLSEVDVKQIEHAQKIVPIVSVQNMYNLENRQWESVLDYTKSRGIAFIPWFPLASGPNGFGSHVHAIAKAHSASTAQIALAWLLRHSENILLIPGTKSIQHLRDNIRAVDITLTEEEFNTLSKLGPK